MYAGFLDIYIYTYIERDCVVYTTQINVDNIKDNRAISLSPSRKPQAYDSGPKKNCQPSIGYFAVQELVFLGYLAFQACIGSMSLRLNRND